MLAGRLQVDQHRRLAAHRIEPFEVDADAEPAGHGVRWISALVLPPTASSTRSALRKAAGVMILSGLKPSAAIASASATSEEGRAGQECVRTWKFWGSP